MIIGITSSHHHSFFIIDTLLLYGLENVSEYNIKFIIVLKYYLLNNWFYFKATDNLIEMSVLIFIFILYNKLLVFGGIYLLTNIWIKFIYTYKWFLCIMYKCTY